MYNQQHTTGEREKAERERKERMEIKVELKFFRLTAEDQRY